MVGGKEIIGEEMMMCREQGGRWFPEGQGWVIKKLDEDRFRMPLGVVIRQQT